MFAIGIISLRNCSINGHIFNSNLCISLFDECLHNACRNNVVSTWSIFIFLFNTLLQATIWIKFISVFFILKQYPIMPKLSSHYRGRLMGLSIVISFCIFFASCQKTVYADNVQGKILTSSNESMASTTSELISLRPDFITGVNGHPLNQLAYLNTPVDKQCNCLLRCILNRIG